MGFNTTVVVHNDSLEAIKNDPDFGKNLVKAIMSLDITGSKVKNVPSQFHCNAAEVIETHHADHLIAVVVGCNSAIELGYAGNWTMLREKDEHKRNVELIKNLAEKEGYTLRKKK